MVVASRVMNTAKKPTLGLTQATIENTSVISIMLGEMIARSLDIEKGLLIVIYCGKGPRKARLLTNCSVFTASSSAVMRISYEMC